jgi:hypothetical protein
MKHHTDHSIGRKQRSVELVNQILQHDPGASVEMVARILSQWGILFNDHNRDPCETEEKQRLHLAGD